MFWTDNYADLKKIEMHNCDLTVTKKYIKHIFDEKQKF